MTSKQDEETGDRVRVVSNGKIIVGDKTLVGVNTQTLAQLQNMNFNSLIAKLFGTKSDRDLKEIMPYVDKVNAIYPTISAMDVNEMRARLQEIRAEIQSAGAEKRESGEDPVLCQPVLCGSGRLLYRSESGQRCLFGGQSEAEGDRVLAQRGLSRRRTEARAYFPDPGADAGGGAGYLGAAV